MLLALDIGTTHCKAGLFTPAGQAVRLAVRPMVSRRGPEGFAYYDPEGVWQLAAEVIREVSAGAAVQAVGVASMAETGLLVERADGAIASPMLPWFDTSASAQAEALGRQRDAGLAFRRTGIPPSFKCSLAKLLWWREDRGQSLEGRVWLAAADFVVQRLTGAMVTDYSLAGRTFGFRLDTLAWDSEWLEALDLPDNVFPPAVPSGTLVGQTNPSAEAATGLAAGTPVCVAGHDHVAAALAGGAIEPGIVFDSMGTAESLIGAVPARPLGDREQASGLTYGCHLVPERYYWMGGLSAAGGSIEWIRSLLNDPPLSYVELDELAAAEPDWPTGLLYLPYLAGSGAPHLDNYVRGALAGLTAAHGRAEFARAVFEGTAYELEYIRRAAEAAASHSIDLIRASGGGTRSRVWMQIKADVSNCCYEVPALADATLLGAALMAGVADGHYPSAQAAVAAAAQPPERIVTPRPEQHSRYAELFDQGYLPLQAPLRALAAGLRGA